MTNKQPLDELLPCEGWIEADVERVARAIQQEQSKKQVMGSPMQWDWYINEAQAAIQAMRVK